MYHNTSHILYTYIYCSYILNTYCPCTYHSIIQIIQVYSFIIPNNSYTHIYSYHMHLIYTFIFIITLHARTAYTCFFTFLYFHTYIDISFISCMHHMHIPLNNALHAYVCHSCFTVIYSYHTYVSLLLCFTSYYQNMGIAPHVTIFIHMLSY